MEVKDFTITASSIVSRPLLSGSNLEIVLASSVKKTIATGINALTIVVVWVQVVDEADPHMTDQLRQLQYRPGGIFQRALS